MFIKVLVWFFLRFPPRLGIPRLVKLGAPAVPALMKALRLGDKRVSILIDNSIGGVCAAAALYRIDNSSGDVVIHVSSI